MTVSTYADVLTSIRDWLARPGDTTTLPDARLADLVQFAEAEIWDRLRIRDMLTTATVTINAQTVAAPSDLLEVSSFYFTDNTQFRVLEPMAPPVLWSRYASNNPGRPKNFTVQGSNLVFGPAPDATYTGTLTYYERPPGLSSSTNTVFAARPQLWVYGALGHSAPLIGNDERIATWRAMFEAALAQAQQASDRAAYSGAPLRIRPA